MIRKNWRILRHYFINYFTSSEIHKSVTIWGGSKIRSGAKIGAQTTIGRNVYIGPGVIIGQKCKIQNNALIYEPAVIGDGVFIGPNVVLTNDKFPRATIGGKVKKEFNKSAVVIHDGASIGAGAICVAPVTIGKYALVGAGSVVVKNVKDFEIVKGIPAVHSGYCNENGLLDV